MKKQRSTMDKNTYAKIYRTYFPKLVRFSQTYIISREDAENIVQDIFVQIWENRKLLETMDNINAFFFTMVKNRCIDYLRQQTQQQKRKQSLNELREKELELKLYSLQAFDEKELSRSEIESIIWKAINTLPERCREIFVLSRLDGLRHKQIAEKLKISTNTVEGQIAIALRKLREELKDFLPLFIFII